MHKKWGQELKAEKVVSLVMHSHSLCSVFSQEVGHGVALVISVASDKHLNKV